VGGDGGIGRGGVGGGGEGGHARHDGAAVHAPG
jgi:hypothetical protein